MMGDWDPRLRFRIWVAARLVDETWIDTGNPEANEHMDNVNVRHRAIATKADAALLPWLVEAYDPEDGSYARFGTDDGGAVLPVAILLADEKGD